MVYVALSGHVLLRPATQGGANAASGEAGSTLPWAFTFMPFGQKRQARSSPKPSSPNSPGKPGQTEQASWQGAGACGDGALRSPA